MERNAYTRMRAQHWVSMSTTCCQDVQSCWAAEGMGAGSCPIAWLLDFVKWAMVCLRLAQLVVHFSDTVGDVAAGKGSALVPLCLWFALCHRPTVQHEATLLLKFGDLGDFASSFWVLVQMTPVLLMERNSYHSRCRDRAIPHLVSRALQVAQCLWWRGCVLCHQGVGEGEAPVHCFCSRRAIAWRSVLILFLCWEISPFWNTNQLISSKLNKLFCQLLIFFSHFYF